ncbi:MAG: hypothetical protein HQM11_20685 [SAR324 cluster bacterium]|nr:hypothetical protein [SAR324 cluster bacterium]
MRHHTTSYRGGYTFSVITVTLISIAMITAIAIPLSTKFTHLKERKELVRDINQFRQTFLDYYQAIGEFPSADLVRNDALVVNPYNPTTEPAKYKNWKGPYVTGVMREYLAMKWKNRDYIFIINPTIRGKQTGMNTLLLMDKGSNNQLDSTRQGKTLSAAVASTDNWLELGVADDLYMIVTAATESLNYDPAHSVESIEKILEVACLTGRTTAEMDWAEQVGWQVNPEPYIPTGSKLTKADRDKIRKNMPEPGPGGAVMLLKNSGLLGNFNITDRHKQPVRWAITKDEAGYFYVIGPDKTDSLCQGTRTAATFAAKPVCELPVDSTTKETWDYFKQSTSQSYVWNLIGDDIPSKPVVGFRAFMRWPVADKADMDLALKYIPLESGGKTQMLFYGSTISNVQGVRHPHIQIGSVKGYLDVDTIPPGHNYGSISGTHGEKTDPQDPSKWIEDIYFLDKPPAGEYIVGVNMYSLYRNAKVPIHVNVEVFQGFCKSESIFKELNDVGRGNPTNRSPGPVDWQLDPEVNRFTIGDGKGAFLDVNLEAGSKIDPGSDCPKPGMTSLGYWRSGQHGASPWINTYMNSWSPYDSSKPASNFQWVTMCARSSRISENSSQVLDVRIEVTRSVTSSCPSQDCGDKAGIALPDKKFLGCSEPDYEHRGFWDATADLGTSGGIMDYKQPATRTTFFANLCVKRQKMLSDDENRVTEIYLDNTGKECNPLEYRGEWDVSENSTGLLPEPQDPQLNTKNIRLCVKRGK